MYKRPEHGESDEDLLKLQDQFYKDKAENKLTPAAKIDTSEKREVEQIPDEEELPGQLSNTFEEVPKFKNMGKVFEKVITGDYKPANLIVQKTGFPIAKRRDPSSQLGSGSIFGQQFKKLKTTNPEEIDKMDTTENTKDYIHLRNSPGKSYTLSQDDKEDIHQENVARLSEMTEEEILEEQNKLLSTTDPAIIAFLKSRCEKQIDKMKPNPESKIIAAENLQVEDITTVNEILNKPEAERWLNFDRMEISKLAWMKDVNMEEIKKENYEARFDFSGWLLPYVEKEITEKNRILYHHGDEPSRPGYTLQELFQLCRSNIAQQKITALNSIANLLALESSGIYGGVLDIPLEQIFFVLRFCLDDNAPFILNAAIRAMRNLFYYPIDEACLDNLLGFGIGKIQPTLCSEKEDEEDDNTVNDQQLAETNLVKCLSRTEILTRIRYVIKTVKPPLETICYCLELLKRLARDSTRICDLILNCEDLLTTITSHFIPKVFKEDLSCLNYGVPLKQAVKLCRILSTRNKNIAERFINEYNIMDSITMYLSNEHFSSNTTGLQLQIECLHLWNVFIHYDLAIEPFSTIEPVLMRMLHYHLQNASQDTATSYTMHGHTAAVLILIGSVAKRKNEYVQPYLQLITQSALNKWPVQFSNANSYLCGKLMIISALLNCLVSVYNNKNGVDHSEVDNRIKMLIQSCGFKMVTANIKSGSNILCPHQAHKPTKNVLTVEGAIWDASERIVPILQTNSCLPFLNALSKFVLKSRSEELKLLFLKDKNLNKYLELIRSTKTYNLTSNWFTRVESELLMNILKISCKVYKDIDTSIFYDVAVKCLCIFNETQKRDIEDLLKTIVFNKDFYPSHVLLANLEVQDENSVLNDCVENLNNILKTYTEVLGLRLNVKNFKGNLSLDVKQGNIIPIDWIYSPIVVLYANNQKENKYKSDETKLTFTIQNCLRWICIYEKYFSNLAGQINPADKFCRLACVFLASDDLFFVPAVRVLLEASFTHFIAKDLNKLDFDKSVHGLTNFQDFYTQILEQYQGVSYGDPLFSNFLLIPLMQKHNLQYRKLLWSEYGGIVQICNMSSDQLMYELGGFLQPAESDMSLLRCYRKFVVEGRLREESVLRIIAKHHLDTYVKNKRST